MSDPFYTARARIRRVDGVHRQAELTDTRVTVDFGVHGAIKEHYRLTDAKNLPLPVDYIVAATAG